MNLRICTAMEEQLNNFQSELSSLNLPDDHKRYLIDRWGRKQKLLMKMVSYIDEKIGGESLPKVIREELPDKGFVINFNPDGHAKEIAGRIVSHLYFNFMYDSRGGGEYFEARDSQK